MTEELSKTEEPAAVEDNAVISDLKAEFTKQFDEFRQQVQKDIEAKDKEIAELKQQNASLSSELVRSARIAPAPEQRPKTAEELYQEEVKEHVERVRNILKSRQLS